MVIYNMFEKDFTKFISLLSNKIYLETSEKYFLNIKIQNKNHLNII